MNWAAIILACVTLASQCQAAPPTETAMNNAQLLMHSVAPAFEADFSIEAWLDSPDRAYRVGEQLQLFARSTEDVFYTVLAIGPRGRAVQLYPTQTDQHDLIHAGQVLVIPGPGGQLQAVPPAGGELIRIIASRAPIELLPSAYGSFPADLPAANLQAAMLRQPGAIAVKDMRLVTIAVAPGQP